MEHGDIYTPCDEDYSQEKYRVQNESRVCDYYKDGDEANKHNQIPSKNYSQETDERELQKDFCYEEQQKVTGLLENKWW